MGRKSTGLVFDIVTIIGVVCGFNECFTSNNFKEKIMRSSSRKSITQTKLSALVISITSRDSRAKLPGMVESSLFL